MKFDNPRSVYFHRPVNSVLRCVEKCAVEYRSNYSIASNCHEKRGSRICLRCREGSKVRQVYW
jgi:hypothetical protein